MPGSPDLPHRLRSTVSKPLLTIRCISCEQDFAWVRVVRQPDEFKDIIGSADWPGDGVQTMVMFRTIREVRNDTGVWRAKRSGLFEESLDVEGLGRTKAFCRRHSYWLEHVELDRAVKERVGVLMRVAASPDPYYGH